MKCFQGMIKLKALHLFIKHTNMVCKYFKIEKSCNACKEVIQKGKSFLFTFYNHVS